MSAGVPVGAAVCARQENARQKAAMEVKQNGTGRFMRRISKGAGGGVPVADLSQWRSWGNGSPNRGGMAI